MNVEIPEKEKLLAALSAALRESDRHRLGVIGNTLADGLWPSQRAHLLFSLHEAGLPVEERYQEELEASKVKAREWAKAEAEKQAKRDAISAKQSEAAKRRRSEKPKAEDVKTAPKTEPEASAMSQAPQAQQAARPAPKPVPATTPGPRATGNPTLFSTENDAVKSDR